MRADQDPACWLWPLWDAGRTARYERWGDDAAGYLLADWHDGRCAMCGCPDVRLVEDHDHSTGLVRGWLCRRCNALEGKNDSPVVRKYRHRPPAVMLGVKVTYLSIFGATPLRPKSSLSPADLQRAVDLLSADG